MASPPLSTAPAILEELAQPDALPGRSRRLSRRQSPIRTCERAAPELGCGPRQEVRSQTRATLPALMHEVHTLSRLGSCRPWRARSGCWGSSGAWCGGASARCCGRSPAPCRRRRSWQPRCRTPQVEIGCVARADGQPGRPGNQRRYEVARTPAVERPRGHCTRRTRAVRPVATTGLQEAPRARALDRRRRPALAGALGAGGARAAPGPRSTRSTSIPVPDGDTGTNLYLTVESAAAAVERGVAARRPRPRPAALARAAPTARCSGARGNSGVILSQLLRGVGRGAVGAEPARSTRPSCAAALPSRRGAGYAAVAEPVEGTMLTVARAAADAAAAPARGDEPAPPWPRRRPTARADALARTPEQLEVLRAGRRRRRRRPRRSCVLLDALVDDGAPGGTPASCPAAGPAPQLPVAAADVDGRGPPDGRRYEVMYLLDAPTTTRSPTLRERSPRSATRWSSSAATGSGTSTCTSTTSAPRSRPASRPAGRTGSASPTSRRRPPSVGREPPARPRRRRRSRPARGWPRCSSGRRGRSCAAARPPPVDRASCSTAVARRRRREVVAAAERRRHPRRSPRRRPSRPAPTGCASPSSRPAATVQALAALAVHDPARRFDDDVVAMTAAAGRPGYGEVTVAVARGADHGRASASPGDVLGPRRRRRRGDRRRPSSDVARTVLDRLLAAGGELVTLVIGGGRRRRPRVDAGRAHLRREPPRRRDRGRTTAASRTTRCSSGWSEARARGVPTDRRARATSSVAATAKALDDRPAACARSRTCCATTRGATPSAAS